MVISMILAGIAGAAVPVVLTALRQDPAQSSSIILTTVTDVAGFLTGNRDAAVEPVVGRALVRQDRSHWCRIRVRPSVSR